MQASNKEGVNFAPISSGMKVIWMAGRFGQIANYTAQKDIRRIGYGKASRFSRGTAWTSN